VLDFVTYARGQVREVNNLVLVVRVTNYPTDVVRRGEVYFVHITLEVKG
jgi:hypothetical protein